MALPIRTWPNLADPAALGPARISRRTPPIPRQRRIHGPCRSVLAQRWQAVPAQPSPVSPCHPSVARLACLGFLAFPGLPCLPRLAPGSVLATRCLRCPANPARPRRAFRSAPAMPGLGLPIPAILRCLPRPAWACPRCAALRRTPCLHSTPCPALACPPSRGGASPAFQAFARRIVPCRRCRSLPWRAQRAPALPAPPLLSSPPPPTQPCRARHALPFHAIACRAKARLPRQIQPSPNSLAAPAVPT